jgi:hypothetical protein
MTRLYGSTVLQLGCPHPGHRRVLTSRSPKAPSLCPASCSTGTTARSYIPSVARMKKRRWSEKNEVLWKHGGDPSREVATLFLLVKPRRDECKQNTSSYLYRPVRGVTREQDVVPGLDSPREPHEQCGVDRQRARHRPRNHVLRLRGLLQPSHHEPPVRHRPPEVRGFRAGWGVDEPDERGRHRDGGAVGDARAARTAARIEGCRQADDLFFGSLKKLVNLTSSPSRSHLRFVGVLGVLGRRPSCSVPEQWSARCARPPARTPAGRRGPNLGFWQSGWKRPWLLLARMIWNTATPGTWFWGTTPVVALATSGPCSRLVSWETHALRVRFIADPC